jgi:Zn-dependent metalloprotease
MAEGAIGAKIGTGLVGRALSTRAAAPFVEWKANQFNKLDTRIDNNVVGLQNFAFEKFGIGGPAMRSGRSQGIVPPYMLEELARRNPSNPDFLDTIKKTEALRAEPLKTPNKVAELDQAGAREVYDARGTETVGTKVRSEGQAKTGIKDVDNVYDYTGDVRSYYKDVHNRNSIDGRGMKMESTVNYGQNYENAFWDGNRMTYGKPGQSSPFETFVLRDVTGHEITHGVTQFESNVIYRGQPGALNESFSDVFGALVEQRARGQRANDATWLVGDGIWKSTTKGRALRDMLNPGTAYDDVALGKDPQPAHMKDYINTRRDNGGVHLNSGIPNRAFALFAKDVGGFAWEGPAQIWYQARANAGSQPSFAQFAYQTIEAAKQLGYTAEVPKLQKAWSDVGIKPSLTDTGVPTGGVIPIITDVDTQKAAS